MKRLLTISIIVLFSQQIFAFPISPQSLRELIIRSQFIVIALIDNPENRDQKFFDPKTDDTFKQLNFSNDGLADLYIKEILKGKSENLEHIQVEYSTAMICPAPADYPDKKMVIAFLGKDDTKKTYFTYGLSYGSKIMENEKEINSFKDRINEYIDILKIKSKRKRKLETVEWLVKCAENKYTRWEGVYGLSRESCYMSRHDRTKDEKLYKKLSKTQLFRLDSAFFATDTLDENEFSLANLISKKNTSNFKDHLIELLKVSDYSKSLDIMFIMLEMTRNDNLKSVLEELENLDSKEREANQKRIIDKFITIATQ